jgi:hypothetical protein
MSLVEASAEALSKSSARGGNNYSSSNRHDNDD